MTFNEMFYLKIRGTATGTTFALTEATLSMDFREIDLHAIIRNTFTLLVSLRHILLKNSNLRSIKDTSE